MVVGWLGGLGVYDLPIPASSMCQELLNVQTCRLSSWHLLHCRRWLEHRRHRLDCHFALQAAFALALAFGAAGFFDLEARSRRGRTVDF